MAFHSLDKALTDRMIRYVMQMASELKGREAPAGFWPKTQDGRKAKRLFDIYGRDAADLKALQARLITEHADQDLIDSMSRRKVAKTPGPLVRIVDTDAVKNAPLELDKKSETMGYLQAAPIGDLGAGAGTGFPTAAELMAGKDGRAHMMDYESDLSRIGQELEPFEQCGKAPGDLADQAAVVVGENG